MKHFDQLYKAVAFRNWFRSCAVGSVLAPSISKELLNSVRRAGSTDTCGSKPRIASYVLMIGILLLLSVLESPARAQVVLPGCVSPIFCPGLTVENLSIYATMPDSNGTRQVTASFRIVNRGNVPTAAGNTTVLLAGGTTNLAMPRLKSGDTAFFSTTTGTTATDFTILVTAPNNSTASYHFVAALPTLGRWRPLGPSVIMDVSGKSAAGVGRITTIAVDPSSASTLYVGARASGLWKTSDGGAEWEPLTDALPTVNIAAVALDETDPKHVFIVTPAGVFGSTDGGHVWTLLYGQDLSGVGSDGGALIVRRFIPRFLSGPLASSAASPSMSMITANPTSPVIPGILPTPLTELRLYLTTQNGLLISRDGGVTWLPPVLGTGATIESLDQDHSNLDHMLATVISSSAAGVYETFSGGLTPGSWHKLQGCPEAPAPDFSIGAFPQSGQIWATQSGSTQWISDRAGTDHELWRTTELTCNVNGSPERGWQLLSSGADTPCIGPGSNGLKPSSEWSFLRADPTNAQILYKAGVKLCRSTDAGATFQEVPVLHDDHHALVFHPAAPEVLVEGDDGGFYRSEDGGQSWAFDGVGLSVTEFMDLDDGGAAPRIVVGGSQDNAMASTDLTSPVWHAVNLGGDPDGDRSTTVVDPLDPTVQYTIGQAVDHLSRIQNGTRDGNPLWVWQNSQTGVDSNGLPEGCLAYSEAPTLFTEFIATSSTAWHLVTTVGNKATGCNGGLWTGPPWHAIFAPPDGETFTRVAFDPANGLFLAGGNAGSIYINFSPDFMAKVWSGPIGSVTAIVPDPSRSANYFVSLGRAFGAGRIFEISPGGVLSFNGQDITANLPPTTVITLASNPFESGVLYAGTTGQGIFRGVRSASGQWEWHPFNNGLPQGAIVTKLRMGSDGTVYAATWGRGAFALDTVPNLLF